MADCPARKRAQEAVVGAFPDVWWIQQAADVASDVWEPLLRDLLADIEFVYGGIPFSLQGQAGYQRAKEALGG